MCEDVELRTNRQCFCRNAYVTNEAVYEKMSLFIFAFLFVPLPGYFLPFFTFPLPLADVALLRLRP